MAACCRCSTLDDSGGSHEEPNEQPWICVMTIETALLLGASSLWLCVIDTLSAGVFATLALQTGRFELVPHELKPGTWGHESRRLIFIAPQSSTRGASMPDRMHTSGHPKLPVAAMDDRSSCHHHSL